MTTFFSSLESRVQEVNSLLCIGLDPHPAELGEQTAEAAEAFCLWLIEAAAGLAAAFKPNAAFFEAFGSQGVEVLQRVIAAVPAGIPVILDAKRGDIASTAEAYARAAFQTLGAGAVTVNPYLGYEAVSPFLSDPGRGVFLLCKTSNPGAADLQDLQVVRPPGPGSLAGGLGRALALYETVALLAQEWNRQDNIGLVVGATQPEALARVRALIPGLWILAPGVGAQGGDLQAALQAGLRPDGMGLLVPVSRAISRAGDPRRAAQEIRDEINRIREEAREQGGGGAGEPERVFPTPLLPRPPAPLHSASLADALLEAGCVRFGQFTLKSGLQSPIYIDLRRLAGYPDLLSQVASAYRPVLNGLGFDRLAALPYAALPIAAAISLQGGWPLVYPRREAKAYGTRAEVEGPYQEGERAVVIDDLATTGGSKFEAIEKLQSAGLQVSDVVVLIDRQSGAAEALEQAGYRLHAVFTLAQLLDYWEAAGKITAGQAREVREFLTG